MNLATGSLIQHTAEQDLFAEVIAALDTTGWCVVPDFLFTDGWQALATEAKALHEEGSFRHAGVGRKSTFQIRPEIRNDQVLWIDPDNPTPLQTTYLNRIETLRQRINQSLMLGLFGFESHFALYPEGSFYRRHLDQFSSASHRTVSCIMYLNDSWLPEHGGALRLYVPQANAEESFIDIMPQGGTAVIFLSSEFEHEVLPANRERFSLTGWFYRRM